MGAALIQTERWFHGTTGPRFSTWQVPPPPVPGEELRVPHTGIFFTKDLDAARKVGPYVCSVRLTDKTRILDATQPSTDTEQLRRVVIENEIARMCIYARTPQAWVSAWRTGEVLRFASDDPRFSLHLDRYAKQFKGVPHDVQQTIAGHNWTRGWIELIVASATKLGFNALHGFEIDRHAGVSPPPAVSWLAVTDAEAVTAPMWEHAAP